jgi:hypothetical protein
MPDEHADSGDDLLGPGVPAFTPSSAAGKAQSKVCMCERERECVCVDSMPLRQEQKTSAAGKAHNKGCVAGCIRKKKRKKKKMSQVASCWMAYIL